MPARTLASGLGRRPGRRTKAGDREEIHEDLGDTVGSALDELDGVSHPEDHNMPNRFT